VCVRVYVLYWCRLTAELVILPVMLLLGVDLLGGLEVTSLLFPFNVTSIYYDSQRTTE